MCSLSPVQNARVKLLSHSQNMLNAAKAQDWDNLTDLDLKWRWLLNESIESFGDELSDIVPQLLDDNEKLQAFVLKSQREMLKEREMQANGLKRTKTYLK